MRLKLLIIVALLITQSSYASVKQNCGLMKKLSKEYLKCKAGNMKVTAKNITNVKIDASNVKEKKYLSDWFKKK